MEPDKQPLAHPVSAVECNVSPLNAAGTTKQELESWGRTVIKVVKARVAETEGKKRDLAEHGLSDLYNRASSPW